VIDLDSGTLYVDTKLASGLPTSCMRWILRLGDEKFGGPVTISANKVLRRLGTPAPGPIVVETE